MENQMNLKQIVINEEALNLQEANQLINNIYNQQINYYKEKFIREWEVNNSINPEVKENKISAIRKAKNDLFKAIRKHLVNNDRIVINTKVEVAVEIKDAGLLHG